MKSEVCGMENLDDRNHSDERERRSKRRFPIDQEVKYTMLSGQRIAETGTGRTLNFSSRGVWFSTENKLPSGMAVELSLGWPVLFNDSCPITLQLYGSVVRSDQRGAAVAVERYEFERERRSRRRFPIDREVQYKMFCGRHIAGTGTGRALNFSSRGVWFSTENMLSSGTPVELSLGWPVLLNDSCPMKITVYSSVVRSHQGGAAVAIERYEFRTSGAGAYRQPVVPAPLKHLPG
jgi:hypothetical protein